MEASNSKSSQKVASKVPKPNFGVPTAAKSSPLALFHLICRPWRGHL